MINILVPMAGDNQYFPENEFPFPKPLIEIGSRTMIERVVQNLETASKNVQFIFIVSNENCIKYHLDKTLSIITNERAQIIRLGNVTKGSACSALLAIDFIDNDIPLLIANSDQLFENHISNLINVFQNVDGGVITFDSVHPRWSYVRLDEKERVIETAEKQPISRNAIAGLYYFSKGFQFIEAAKKMIKKEEHINGSYFIAPVFNQMILSGKEIRMNKIKNSTFHTFYTPLKIKEYENYLHQNLVQKVNLK